MCIFISVNCNAEFWESPLRATVWLHEDPGTHVFELGLNGFGLGLMIFHKMSPRTHHNYLYKITEIQ